LLRRWVLLGFGLALRCSSGLLLAAGHHPVPFSIEQQPHLRRGFGPNPDWLDIRNPVMEVQDLFDGSSRTLSWIALVLSVMSMAGDVRWRGRIRR
jgi:hypothetical protein